MKTIASFDKLRSWAPPEGWRSITTLDVHTGGEPLRVVLSGFPELPGETILARRRVLKEKYDDLRTAILWEPRGHREMYGCIVTPPVSQGADFGVLFMHNEGYSTMCGHGIIALGTIAVETRMVPLTEPTTTLAIDSPAGRISARVRIRNGRASSVTFRNVPSFVVSLDETVDVPGLGRITYDLAFGGAFYAYVQADQVGLRCVPDELPRLLSSGMAIKRAVMGARKISHPYEPDLGFLYGTIFISRPIGDGAHSRNVCIFADGEVDRSPTGTGVSGRVAIHHARKEIGLHQPLVIESIIGSRFTAQAVEETTFGGYPAVLPEVEGTAHITGRHEFLLDPEDPLSRGFIL